MFKGNKDSDSIQYNVFDVPIIAQWVRINPTRWQDRISLRVELYGCEYGKLSIMPFDLYYIVHSFGIGRYCRQRSCKAFGF